VRPWAIVRARTRSCRYRSLDRLSLLHTPHCLRCRRCRTPRRSAFGTETEQDTSGGRDPYTRFNAVMPTEGPLTDAGLEVWSRGIYDLVMQITHEYNRPVIEITESGCRYLDTPYEGESGHVPDARRIEFFRNELAELARTISDSANVRAFHAWSLLDNFERADGYSQRYGLTYVDFRDQKRTVKDSGLWYRKVAGLDGL
jgi:beta-glucosidase